LLFVPFFFFKSTNCNGRCAHSGGLNLEKVQFIVQSISRVIMSPKELKIHLQGKYPGLPCKCIVGCIFNSVGLITTSENTLYNIFF
jgi:hypothetical protein